MRLMEPCLVVVSNDVVIFTHVKIGTTHVNLHGKKKFKVLLANNSCMLVALLEVSSNYWSPHLRRVDAEFPSFDT